MAFLFSFHCDSPDQGSAKSRSGKFSLPRSAHLGEAVANLLGVQRWLLPGGEVAPPVQDVVMDQVWHPPIDPAPRRAEGLARIDADAYGNLQPDRRDAHGEAFPDVEAVDGGLVLAPIVRHRLAAAPVVAVTPVIDQRLDLGERGALG